MSLALAGILIAVVALAVTLAPLRRSTRPTPAGADGTDLGAGRRAPLEQRKLELYDSLKDLKFELDTGKLAQDDYEPAREALLKEAASVVRELDSLGAEDDIDRFIEQQVQARGLAAQAGAPTGQPSCPACGAAGRIGSPFCPACGARIEPEPCPTCGRAGLAGDQFCAGCGGELVKHAN